jgi:hypothetical protein
MTRIGDGYMLGRHAEFRTYETSDHIEGLVWYGDFRSEQEAKLATKLSLKDHGVTSKEQVRDLNGRVIGNRIVVAPKQEKKAFMVIRTHDLHYWIVQSISLVVAMQLDGLIEPPRPLPALAQDKKDLSSCDRFQQISVEAAAVIQGRAEEGSPNLSPRVSKDPGQRSWRRC